MVASPVVLSAIVANRVVVSAIVASLVVVSAIVFSDGWGVKLISHCDDAIALLDGAAGVFVHCGFLSCLARFSRGACR
jgi:hypothetical protein